MQKQEPKPLTKQARNVKIPYTTFTVVTEEKKPDGSVEKRVTKFRQFSQSFIDAQPEGME